jgi:hypothetical protein
MKQGQFCCWEIPWTLTDQDKCKYDPMKHACTVILMMFDGGLGQHSVYGIPLINVCCNHTASNLFLAKFWAVHCLLLD